MNSNFIKAEIIPWKASEQISHTTESFRTCSLIQYRFLQSFQKAQKHSSINLHQGNTAVLKEINPTTTMCIEVTNLLFKVTLQITFRETTVAIPKCNALSRNVSESFSNHTISFYGF